MEEITKQDGTIITRQEATTCDKSLAGPYHEFVYHRDKRQYKCTRCHQTFDKVDLKALTD